MKEVAKPRIVFSTLGCRVNQYETQAIREQFLNLNFEETKKTEDADVVVLNTCTVTAESDRESRYLIRRFHRLNPKAKIIVTGCYVERNRDAIESLPGVVLTAGNQEKQDLAARFLEDATACHQTPGKHDFSNLSISRFEGRTRAYVKIQDGCNHACSFCKVVLVRGPSRSRAPESVLEEAKRLAGQGIPEIVLTGIQLGAFGRDLEKPEGLAGLLEKLVRIPGLKRIRLSSIEPMDVTKELISAMASFQKVCPHLHIPLQSGDDQILKRMNRRYSSASFRDLVSRIRASVNDFILTTDVIVGFPGEDEGAFESTVALLREAVPYKLHIFPYSRREGTRAAGFNGSVPAPTIKGRKQILLDLEPDLKKIVMSGHVGREACVLTEKNALPSGWAEGRMANYMTVRFQVPDMAAGSFCHVEIQAIEQDNLVGTLLKQKEVA